MYIYIYIYIAPSTTSILAPSHPTWFESSRGWFRNVVFIILFWVWLCVLCWLADVSEGRG